jgi:predicted RNA methylase
MSHFFKLLAEKSLTFLKYYRERRVKSFFKEVIRFKLYLPLLKFHGVLIDRYYSIDTEGIVELPLLGIDKDVGSRQESTPFNHISNILQTLKITPEDVFVDMGSGKGRVLLMAGLFPFKCIVGVDVSQKLNEICKLNIERMKKNLKAKNFLIITSNANDYEIPDDATFIYFFNPFGMEVMKKVVERIIDSVDRHPRKVTIIWHNPKYEMEFERYYDLKKTREINWRNFGLYLSKVVFYEVNQ